MVSDRLLFQVYEGLLALKWFGYEKHKKESSYGNDSRQNKINRQDPHNTETLSMDRCGNDTEDLE